MKNRQVEEQKNRDLCEYTPQQHILNKEMNEERFESEAESVALCDKTAHLCLLQETFTNAWKNVEQLRALLMKDTTNGE